MTYSFVGRIRKVGTSYVVTIPKDYVKHGIIETSKWYIFNVRKDPRNDSP